MGFAMTLSVLVTGFGAFPGAPVNPTQELIGMLAGREDAFPGAKLHLRVLPVEYGKVGGLLEQFGREINPDIAIHFGLAANARGFRLESTARNHSSMQRPDSGASTPQSTQICKGPKSLRSTLPLGDIAQTLKAMDLPVTRSAHAGAYLCNHLFYLSRSNSVAGYRPQMAGFIHLPYLDDQLGALPPSARAGLVTLTRPQLVDGAMAVIGKTIEAARRLD